MSNQLVSEVCCFSMPRALAALHEDMIQRVLNGEFHQIAW